MSRGKQHVPTEAFRRQVKAMSSYGIPQEDIAPVLGISEKTLRKHYRRELDTAETQANAMVAQNLFKMATGKGPGAVTAAIFWMKTRAGWKERRVTELTGEDGGPIDMTVESADSKRASIASKLARIAAANAESHDDEEEEGEG